MINLIRPSWSTSKLGEKFYSSLEEANAFPRIYMEMQHHTPFIASPYLQRRSIFSSWASSDVLNYFSSIFLAGVFSIFSMLVTLIFFSMSKLLHWECHKIWCRKNCYHKYNYSAQLSCCLVKWTHVK